MTRERNRKLKELSVWDEYDEMAAVLRAVPCHFAAPTPVAINTPAGLFLQNGYSTKIVFSRAPTIGFWEKTVQPGESDNGEPIEIVTMRDTQFVPMVPNSPLVKHGPSQVVCAYDPLAISDADTTLIGQPGTVTEQYADGSTKTFYGYLQKMARNAHARGAFPECTLTIVETDWDYVNRVVAGPVYTNVAGS